MQPRRFRGNVLAPLALAALLGGCGLVPEPAPDYLVDSGYRVAIDYVYWLDAHRILFVGSPVDEPYPPPYRSAITIWDTRTDEFEVYKRVSGLTRLCYADGWISYLPDRLRVPRSEGTRRLHWGGPMGEEEWLNPESKPGHRLHWNRYSCRYQHLEVEEDGSVRGRPLRIGDGRLVMSGLDENSNRAVRWLDSDGNLIQALDQIAWAPPRYFAHLKGYLFGVHASTDKARQQWRQTNCLSAYVLRIHQTTAEIDELCVPWTNIRAISSLQIIPLRRGFFVFGQPFDRRKHGRGGYFVNGDDAIQLFAGQLLASTAVSRDGCRVAVAPKTLGGDPITLKYVDTCKLMEELGNDKDKDNGGRST